MYSKIRMAGHPLHPMLIAFPVACYTGTLAGFAVYGANGHLFWLNLAIALNVVGVGTAVVAAIPGLADWALGIPYHVGVKLAPEQVRAEPMVQHAPPPIPLRRHHAA